MKRSPLRMICKGTKTMQRVGSKVPCRLAKNVKIKKINIFQTTCIKCSNLPKCFEQRCCVKLFCKKIKLKWCNYCVLLFVRETAVREKHKHRSRHALDGLLSQHLLWNANVTNRECLPYLWMILETCSKHALRYECLALLASQSAAVLMQSLLNSAWLQGELFN